MDLSGLRGRRPWRHLALHIASALVVADRDLTSTEPDNTSLGRSNSKRSQCLHLLVPVFLRDLIDRESPI
ncbi:MAG: hypothetical protein AAF219_00865 [Myxococcota bacterium]